MKEKCSDTIGQHRKSDLSPTLPNIKPSEQSVAGGTRESIIIVCGWGHQEKASSLSVAGLAGESIIIECGWGSRKSINTWSMAGVAGKT